MTNKIKITYRKITLIFLIFSIISVEAQQSIKKNIYLIPGQGSDKRLYKNLKLDTSLFKIHFVNWIIPNRKENLKSYAQRLSAQIDTSQKFYLIGVSLGGMVATEISEILNPEKIIVISSAKCRAELPLRYRFQKYIPAYSLAPKRLIKWSSFIAQPIVEPDRNKEKATCKAMLKAKSPVFLKRTIRMIVRWDRKTYNPNIIHIHGNNDHTIPIRNVKNNYTIKTGSHMMILTRTGEIESLILKIIE